jgi:MFS family permease
VPAVLRRFGYRSVLTWNALIASALVAACALFTAQTPILLMLAILFAGGFFRSLQFTSAMTIGFGDVEPARMSRATSLAAVCQQLSVSTGIAIGALTVQLVLGMRHEAALSAADFPPAFLVVSAISALSIFMFARMPANAGDELTGKAIIPAPGPAETATREPRNAA